ncbi:glycosyltransferase [Marispirochaeta aestuarii]|uniref:glycosyltransferase n=1 Tax=Marispirochaeta aestuarii TaxID=1963862 RepID=UPI0029C8BDA4|nr:glycosyltransferase [Marispirochaeta aestuarii]
MLNLTLGYAARLRRLAGRPELAGKVEFCGRLTDSELCEAYRGADVFCLPSDYEGFGIVYLEALGAGCVGIASASGGADRKLLIRGKMVFLYHRRISGR